MIWIDANIRGVVHLTCDQCPDWSFKWHPSSRLGPRVSECDMQDVISHHNFKFHRHAGGPDVNASGIVFSESTGMEAS